MQADPATDRAMHRVVEPGRWSPWLQLLATLLKLAGGKAELVRHGERRWASATFSGTRHTVLLAFHGAEAIGAGKEFIAALPEHEFRIPRQLVADAAVIGVEQLMLPEPRLEVEAEPLLLDDA